MPIRSIIWLLAALVTACARHAPPPPPTAAIAHAGPHCLDDGSGYLRLRADGTLPLNLDWGDAGLECEGSPRPDGQGIRLTFARPEGDAGHRPRLVIGLSAASAPGPQHAVPANLTLILEGEDRIFATRGDGRCTVDELDRTALGEKAWRVAGRGFCLTPALSLDGRQSLLISRFDFAGKLVDAEPGDHRE